MENIELIPFIRDTLAEYKLMLNDNLINTISNPNSTFDHCKLCVGQMGGAEGFALSLIALLQEDDTDG